MKAILKKLKRGPVVNVVRLSGVIAESGRFGGNALNAATLAPVLERAFRKGKPKAVALALNSPGGLARTIILDRCPYTPFVYGSRNPRLCVLRRCGGIGGILVGLCCG